jgi:hypothetical protein
MKTTMSDDEMIEVLGDIARDESTVALTRARAVNLLLEIERERPRDDGERNGDSALATLMERYQRKGSGRGPS